MSQKRDFELAESARKTVLKPKGSFLGLDIKRSVSLDDNMRFNRLVSMQSQLIGTSDEVSCRKKRLRVVLLNAIDILLSDHTNDEARFLKQPIALFNCYFTSTYFRRKRLKQQLKSLGCAHSRNRQQPFSIDLQGRVYKEPQVRLFLKDLVSTPTKPDASVPYPETCQDPRRAPLH